MGSPVGKQTSIASPPALTTGSQANVSSPSDGQSSVQATVHKNPKALGTQ